jgi:hypothetical protein
MANVHLGMDRILFSEKAFFLAASSAIVWSELFVGFMDFTEHAMPCKRYQLGIRPVSSGLNAIIFLFYRDRTGIILFSRGSQVVWGGGTVTVTAGAGRPGPVTSVGNLGVQPLQSTSQTTDLSRVPTFPDEWGTL